MTTDAAGSYSVADLPAGSYYVRSLGSGGYFGALFDQILCPFNSCEVTRLASRYST